MSEGYNVSSELEIEFPLEFSLEWTPLSLQASGNSKSKWKSRIAEKAKEQLKERNWLTRNSVSVTIYYFPLSKMMGDIDNIVKPILDALTNLIYRDDHQVDRVLVRKFEGDVLFHLLEPTVALSIALERCRPVVYIRVDDDVSRGEQL